jgi:type VI secretion system ImpC/EvpB family protein
VVITDRRERELTELGFVPLCACRDTAYAAFYGTPTIQKPKTYDNEVATANALISSMLHYMLCVSRFTHYVKLQAREWIGTTAEAEELENALDGWVNRYVTRDGHASLQQKSHYPLREAKVHVRPDPGRPGGYMCTVHLCPHYQFDDLAASVQLSAQVAPPPRSNP